MHRKLLLAMLPPLLALFSSSPPPQHGPDAEGQPTQLRQGSLESYWIWHDYEGYHVRTTTAHDRHAFHGRIEFSNGEAWARAFQLKPDDVVKLGERRIEFHLSTQENLTGFDFRIDYPNQATFHLEIDDRKGPGVLEHVFVGQANAHPATTPFTLAP